MTEDPSIYYEVVEEIWTSAPSDSVNGIITFIYEGNEHIINSNIIYTCLRLPDIRFHFINLLYR